MSELPASRAPHVISPPAPPVGYPEFRETGPHLSELIAIFVRHRWLILGCVVVMVTLAAAYTLRTTPIYEAASTVRIEDKEPNLPEFYRTLTTGSEVLTEMEVLQSGTLARDAAAQLGLRLRLTKPTGVSRSELFRDISVASKARQGSAGLPTEFTLRREASGKFALRSPGRSGAAFPPIVPGQHVNIEGIEFTLAPSAREYGEIRFDVQSLEGATEGVLASLSVSQTNRDAKIVRVAYRDADPQLAAQVPNAIVSRFIARRQDAQKIEARSTAEFLRHQIDTLAGQLRTAEDKLRRFRERERVVNPEVEASTQVTRLIELQSERGTLEAERAALAKLLAEVRTAKRQGGELEPSPYRRLLAFPTLLRNQAATELLKSLAGVEDQRASLLARRTPTDPDVRALTARVDQIEEQLGAVAATYSEGLANQVTSLDTTLSGFGRQLGAVPRRELEFARLQRQPKVLEDVYSLLQTRLKEAEIKQAVVDPSVQVVDAAIVPRDPIRPRPILNLAAALLIGLLLGVAGAFVREYMDRSVHTRADVLLATGLPVLGLIPSIAGRGERVALIGKKREGRSAPPRIEPRLLQPASSRPRHRFTFLSGPAEEDRAVEPASRVPVPLHPVAHIVITDVGAAVAEAYGSLRTNLLYAKEGEPARTVVITSAQEGEGKTTNAVNLALSLAHRGASALLIDADLRRGMIHKVLGGPRQPGLSDILFGKSSFEQAVRYAVVEDGQTLHYLTTGTLVGNPAALLESESLRVLIRQVRERYDTIILDSPPGTVITDAALLGSQADGVVIIARAGVTHAAALECVMEQLGRVRAQVLGVVLNDIDFKRDAAYDPAYQYHAYTPYVSPASE